VTRLRLGRRTFFFLRFGSLEIIYRLVHG
jgi:hypothetical protein